VGGWWQRLPIRSASGRDAVHDFVGRLPATVIDWLQRGGAGEILKSDRDWSIHLMNPMDSATPLHMYHSNLIATIPARSDDMRAFLKAGCASA
jgi:hypothetical protein